MHKKFILMFIILFLSSCMFGLDETNKATKTNKATNTGIVLENNENTGSIELKENKVINNNNEEKKDEYFNDEINNIKFDEKKLNREIDVKNKNSLIELFILLLDNNLDYNNKVLINDFGDDVSILLDFYNNYIFGRETEITVLKETDFELMKCLDGNDYELNKIQKEEDKMICLGEKGYNKDYNMDFFIEKNTTKIFKNVNSGEKNICKEILGFDYNYSDIFESIESKAYDYMICDSIYNKLSGSELLERYKLFFNSFYYNNCNFINNLIDKINCNNLLKNKKKLLDSNENIN